jgi:hypothetical protein
LCFLLDRSQSRADAFFRRARRRRDEAHFANVGSESHSIADNTIDGINNRGPYETERRIDCEEYAAYDRATIRSRSTCRGARGQGLTLLVSSRVLAH